MLNGLEKEIERLTNNLSLKNTKKLEKHFYAFQIDSSSAKIELFLQGDYTKELFSFFDKEYVRGEDSLFEKHNCIFYNFHKKINGVIVNITLSEKGE